MEKNGRAAGGRFAPGNKIAQGRGWNADKVKALHDAMYKATRPEHVRKAIETLVKQFDHENPEVARKAVELFLNRVLGKVPDQVHMEVTDDRPQRDVAEIAADLKRVLGQTGGK